MMGYVLIAMGNPQNVNEIMQTEVLERRQFVMHVACVRKCGQKTEKENCAVDSNSHHVTV